MNCLIFGCYGSIGNYLFNKFETNMNVYGTTTNKEKTKNNIFYVTSNNYEELNKINNIDIIIWAQGINHSDNIENFDILKYNDIIDGNITFIISTLNFLITNNKINDNAKMVIISSIWEELTRQNKLSYTISKSALSGLVKNLSIELSKKNILINNILPGVIDNEMTNKFLNEQQLNYIKNYVGFNRLITLEDIYNTTNFLVTANTGVTGQSIKVDLGFTNIKKI